MSESAPRTYKKRCTGCCGDCGRHFRSQEALDLHRRGDHANGRYCVAPGIEEPRLIPDPDATECDTPPHNPRCEPPGEVLTGVVVWTTARSQTPEHKEQLRRLREDRP